LRRRDLIAPERSLMGRTRRISSERGGIAMAGAGVLGLLIVMAIILFMMTAPFGGGGGAAAPGGGGGGGGTSYLGAVAGSQQRARQFSVETKHYALMQMMASYNLEHDSYPETFEDLGQENSAAWKDHWGTQIRFVIDETVSPAMMTVESAGRDTTWGTPDDLSHTAPLPF